MLKKNIKPSMVAHECDPNIQGMRQGDRNDCQAIMGYGMRPNLKGEMK